MLNHVTCLYEADPSSLNHLEHTEHALCVLTMTKARNTKIIFTRPSIVLIPTYLTVPPLTMFISYHCTILKSYDGIYKMGC